MLNKSSDSVCCSVCSCVFSPLLLSLAVCLCSQDWSWQNQKNAVFLTLMECNLVAGDKLHTGAAAQALLYVLANTNI